ncbi:MAG: 3-deoxy-D-manno-octulosonic acid kinase [Granulosicoccus sp.]
MSSNEVLSTSVTQKDPDALGIYWRYSSKNTLAFNPIVFDEIRLAEHNLISGQAEAGRGNAFFLNLEGHLLVLRHYRRGGVVQRVSANRYIFTGLSRTRAMLEFDILQKMYDMKLPVPKPYACRVVQYGATYEASIVTHRLQGNTLAHQLIAAAVSGEQWKNIGITVARFHREGIFHADLNAHNILLNDEGLVSLIDFDRANFRSVNTNASNENWCVSNLDRLQRSLEKVSKQKQGVAVEKLTGNLPVSTSTNTVAKASPQDVKQGFELLKSSWNRALT